MFGLGGRYGGVMPLIHVYILYDWFGMIIDDIFLSHVLPCAVLVSLSRFRFFSIVDFIIYDAIVHYNNYLPMI